MKASHFAIMLATWFWTCLCFSTQVSCKTPSSAGPTVAVTCSSLRALGDSFVATGATIDAAFDAKLLAPRDYLPWRDFALRFKAAYAVADPVCEKAVASGDRSVIETIQTVMSTFGNELPKFVVLGIPATQPGGVQ